MADLLVLKRKYNSLISRYNKAEKYFETASSEEVEKWLPEFNKIVMGLSELMYQIPGMTQDEVFYGFKDIS